MIFKYGNYAHARDEVLLRTVEQGIFDSFGRRMGGQIEWTIIGTVIVADSQTLAQTQASLTTALNSLRTAYASDYLDAALYLDDGTTPTTHVLQSSTTFGGVKVAVPPSFLNGPWGGRIEYSNRRHYYVVLKAEYRVGEGLYSWQQDLSIQGTGGPVWRYSPQMSGSPQKQDPLQTASTFYYIQEGQAVGRKAYPAIDPPLFPSIEHQEQRIIKYSSPRDVVPGDEEMFPVSWRYVMEATTAQGFTAFVVPTVT